MSSPALTWAVSTKQPTPCRQPSGELTAAMPMSASEHTSGGDSARCANSGSHQPRVCLRYWVPTTYTTTAAHSWKATTDALARPPRAPRETNEATHTAAPAHAHTVRVSCHVGRCAGGRTAAEGSSSPSTPPSSPPPAPSLPPYSTGILASRACASGASGNSLATCAASV
jgi:hypothetical protein